MSQEEPITKKVGNTTIIIYPDSAKTQEEIEQVEKNLEDALRRAWLNTEISKKSNND